MNNGYSRTMNKNDYISFKFNKRIKIVLEKYNYISLEGIVRSQYYFPSNKNNFNPIKVYKKRII
ncbi:hypothetical protein UA42_19815 [Photobacterium kishitanii]|uniref:Uncharacterized protein n=1 Tax=Photobacterium kishitanii TaxID=318456 RepID=A0AAX0Z1I3_9GAMM|nr:hypothetical protein UA42_19815 [Photobacterium kishitanii]PSX20172.1 hypothetical protein C0W70_04585 [Photobacterium kishitanii]PSX27899.1 hypothetical protein C0W52_10955 [Photobacterium kishitanii]PSX32079.1 hypothetical protein C0W39_12870 [Photobacterium kishitanii]PSX46399.1 hypothetical protein C0W53_05650 [Photobacterium kishitanii]